MQSFSSSSIYEITCFYKDQKSDVKHLQRHSIDKAFISKIFLGTKILIFQLMLGFMERKTVNCRDLQGRYNNDDRKPNITFG